MEKNAVVFCVTGPHLQLATVAIYSLIDHYQSETSLKILVVCDNIFQRDISFVRSLPNKMNKPMISIDFWQPPELVKDIKPYRMNGRSDLAPAMVFWRMFLPSYFSGYQKILYLDNDVVINTDVTNLFNALDDSHTLAAVGDFLFNAGKEFTSDSSISNELSYFYGMSDLQRYFNGGVIVMNVAKYNDSYSPSQILEIISSTSWNLADQTLMNIMFKDSTILLPYRYNFQHSLDYFNNRSRWLPSKREAILAEYPATLIRHFAGEEPLSAPYEHVIVRDKWEETFWKTMMSVKKLAFSSYNDR